jgi:organic radical activating enzyme
MKSIGVLCTTRCNTGCKFCSFNSVPKGEDMPLDVIRALKKSIKKCKDLVEVIFTGGGEPLQWSHLPEAVRLLKNIPGIALRLITSGCLSENDERFPVLKESLRQAGGKLHIDHSFNPFSPTFPQRLAFTLPFILLEGAYKATFIKMVSGLSLSIKDNRMDFHFDEVRKSLEKALEQAIGRCSKLIYFPAEENNYSPKRITPLLLKEASGASNFWFDKKAFQASNVYFPYALPFRDRLVISYGSFVNTHGRALKFSPPIAENAFYNFGLGFDCGVLGKTLDLSTDGKFLLCPCAEFPPFSVGVAGDSLEKASRVKKNIASKVINVRRQELLSLGFDLCGDCTKKAWEIYYKTL